MACLPLEVMPARRKSCAVTRSSSSRITERAVLEEALAAHTTRLGEKLRREGLGTDHVTIFYHASVHDRDEPMRSVSTTVRLPGHSSNTLALIRAARSTVRREPDARPWRYAKAGIVTTYLVPPLRSPRALIGALDCKRSGPQMAAMDACSTRWDRGAMVPARLQHEVWDAHAALHDVGRRAAGCFRLADMDYDAYRDLIPSGQ